MANGLSQATDQVYGFSSDLTNPVLLLLSISTSNHMF